MPAPGLMSLPSLSWVWRVLPIPAGPCQPPRAQGPGWPGARGASPSEDAVPGPCVRGGTPTHQSTHSVCENLCNPTKIKVHMLYLLGGGVYVMTIKS